jgi:hypothetical protein
MLKIKVINLIERYIFRKIKKNVFQFYVNKYFYNKLLKI